MSISDQSRVEWIDSAKALSILMVTFFHLALYAQGAGFQAEHLVQLNAFLEPIRMPLFFAVSGVFAGNALGRSWNNILSSKVALFIWLFAVWTIVRWSICAYLVGNPLNPREGSTFGELGWAIVAPTTGVWFLWTLSIFFIAAKLLRHVDYRTSILAAAFVSVVTIALSDAHAPNLSRHLLSNIAHRNTLIYFFYFYSAARMPSLIKRLGTFRIGRALPIAMVLFIGSLFLMRHLPYPLDAIGRFASSIIGVAALFILARMFDSWSLLARPLHFVGLKTLPIYLAQGPLILLGVVALRQIKAEDLGTAIVFLAPLGVVLIVWLCLQLHHLLIRAGAPWFYGLPQSGSWGLFRRRSLAVELPSGEIF